MKYAFALALPFYLSCAVHTTSPQIPVIYIEHHPAAMITEEVRPQKIPPPSPAKEAAEFITKKLEELISENPGTTRVRGEISLNGSPARHFNYTFDTADFCEVGSGEQVSKGTLFIHFQDWKYVTHGFSTISSAYTAISFNTVRPFYDTENFLFNHTEFPANSASSISKLDFYPAFPEAQKMYEEMLLYIAQELKQESLDIDTDDEKIVIRRPDQPYNKHDEKFYQSYVDLINALPEKSPYPPEARYTFLEPCKP